MECLVSIFTIGINSKSIPLPLQSAQETYPKFFPTSDVS